MRIIQGGGERLYRNVWKNKEFEKSKKKNYMDKENDSWKRRFTY